MAVGGGIARAAAAVAVAVAMAVANTLQDDERMKTIKHEQNEDRNRLSDETPPHLRSAARNARPQSLTRR